MGAASTNTLYYACDELIQNMHGGAYHIIVDDLKTKTRVTLIRKANNKINVLYNDMKMTIVLEDDDRIKSISFREWVTKEVQYTTWIIKKRMKLPYKLEICIYYLHMFTKYQADRIFVD